MGPFSPSPASITVNQSKGNYNLLPATTFNLHKGFPFPEAANPVSRPNIQRQLVGKCLHRTRWWKRRMRRRFIHPPWWPHLGFPLNHIQGSFLPSSFSSCRYSPPACLHPSTLFLPSPTYSHTLPLFRPLRGGDGESGSNDRWAILPFFRVIYHRIDGIICVRNYNKKESISSGGAADNDPHHLAREPRQK